MPSLEVVHGGGGKVTRPAPPEPKPSDAWREIGERLEECRVVAVSGREDSIARALRVDGRGS
jgi:hypothetical protein